ncbi:MAG: ATP-binding protein [Terriglobales bacterium]
MTADELPLRRAVLGESVSGDILEGIRPDGQVTTVLASAAPPFDEQGRARGAVGAFVDITEQMRAENELRKQSVELSAVNKELEAFNSAVAHDLRAPLRHIHGFAQILADDAGPKQHLKTIQNSANHRRQLLEDLLNLSKLGRQELHKQLCGWNSLIEEVLVKLEPGCKDREIEWRIAELPFIECDPALMKQVLFNLLGNALKFTRTRERAIIEIGQSTIGAVPAIFIRDNGVGFSMKYVEKLFGLFQRLHREEDFEGTGVGLAIVQRIVHRHDGRVRAEAELNKGATFYLNVDPGKADSKQLIATDAAS